MRQRFYGIDDILADSLVDGKFHNIHQMRQAKYCVDHNIPFTPIFLPQANDSSTGPGQITINTGIDAYNYYLEKGGTPISDLGNKLDYNSNADNEKMWNYLNVPSNNIDMICLVLKYKAGGDINDSNIKDAVRKYNGKGDHALKYSEAFMEYYESFKKYNLSN